jgi:AcrR family transcriptional regulator
LASREQNKSQRKREILSAARVLMRGPDEATFSMRALAEEAGVSIATPYNLFGSKQAILVALLDDDLAEYQAELAQLSTEGVDALFDAVALMTRQFAREPDYYRNVFAVVCAEAGPELRFVISGPRYALWKNLLRDATQAGLLDAGIDPDAFAITFSQLLFANVQEWSLGFLELVEMDARIRYGLALALTAVATDRSRRVLTDRLRSAERDLQTLWRAALKARLREGPLDDATRAVLADQLKHVGTPILEQSEEDTVT